MIEKVYVVEGETGEYEDRHSWRVAAYADEELAKEHVRLAQACADAIFTEVEADDEDWAKSYRVRREAVERKLNPHDPGMCMDFDGTRYSYYEVEVAAKLKVWEPPNGEEDER